ncbi:MAG: BlaI/MecI/CopY family transcriptional regulator [Firmicutes bacterium HGW-Firmicutes-7]|nr:MAG: BlaI/MecI/CopY family transcriptional regulator [Firmicutes bacterium HGW-Firmicutes-7]
MEKFKLFDAEYKFMCIIWDTEPVNSTTLSKICFEKLGWKKSTTYNMIRKLVERGVLENENATVCSLLKKEDVQKHESETLLEKAFDGSLPAFFASFLKDKKLTQKDAEELRRMIEEATK